MLEMLRSAWNTSRTRILERSVNQCAGCAHLRIAVVNESIWSSTMAAFAFVRIGCRDESLDEVDCECSDPFHVGCG